MMAILGIVAGVCSVAIVFRPAIGSYLLLFTTPLIGGIARGPVPLRPNEMLLLLVAAALAVRVVLLMLSRRYRSPRFDRMDAALLLLAATSSALPVLWRMLRGLPLTQDDVLYSIVLIKYYVLFRVFRGTIVTTAQVMTCLWVAMAGAAIEAIIAVLQVLNLLGVPNLLHSFYDHPFEGESAAITDRATSTLASAFGHADLMMMSFVIALGLLRMRTGPRWLLVSAATLFLAGCTVSGEFSGYIGLLVTVLAFGSLFGGSFRRMLPGMIGGGALMAIPFWGVVAERLAGFSGEGGLPHSWTGRLDNLERFFLPKLMEGANWALGVQPAPRVPAPEAWRDAVYIECGYVWLLWIGGVPFFLAFVYFVITALGLLRAIAKSRTDAVGAAAGAGYCYVVTLTVLMLFDPHLTLRGTADLLFPLLAMSLVRQPAMAPLRRPLPLFPDARSLPATFPTGGMRAAID
jgi:hypothetical protein